MDPKRRDWVVPLLFGLGGLVLAHHEMVLSGFAVTQNDLGDTRLEHYLMEHVWRWLLGQPAHQDFWSPPVFYPLPGTLAWSDVMLTSAVFYIPFRAVGVDPHNAFQAWIVVIGLTNFACTWLLFRRGLGFGTLAASVGAALFSYSAARVNMTMHWQMFPHFFTSLAALSVCRLAMASQLSERARVGHIFLLAGATVAQFYVGIYLGFFLVFIFVVGVALGLAWPRFRAEVLGLLRSNPWTLGFATLASIALLYPMVWRYLETSKQFGGRPYGEILTMLPQLHVWLHMGRGSWFWGWLADWPVFQRIPMEHEQRCGFGLIATALALWGFYRFRNEPRIFFIGLLSVALVLLTSLYAPDGTSPWRLVHAYFPGADGIRAVSRAAVTYMLGVACGVAAVVNLLEQHKSRAWMALPLGALLVLEQGYDTPAFSKADNRRDIAQVAAAVEPGCQAFLMSPAQPYGPYWKYQLDAMWGALESGVPTIMGYSGQSPPGWALGDTGLRGPGDEYRVAQAARSWIQANPGLQDKKVCWARVGFNEGPHFGSRFVSQQVPPSMVAGSQTTVEVVFENPGPKPWAAGGAMFLGSQAPQDTSTWGGSRVPLPRDTPVGQRATFQFAVTAPQQAGRYPFQWRLVHEGMQWIGELSKVQEVEVVPAPAAGSAPSTDAGQ